MAEHPRVERSLPRLVVGFSIVAAGVIFTLENLAIVEAEHFLAYWPVVLIGVGFAQLVQTKTWGGYIGSLIWVFAGAWLLGWNIGLVTVSIWKLTPLLLVLLGGNVIWRAMSNPVQHVNAEGKPAPESYVRGLAIMSGIGRTSDAADFRGADLFALMGGCKLDLRQATIAGNEAVIDVFVMMGGIELRVPETWSIDARVLPLMGGISDERRPSAPAGTETQRLVIRGTVLMGGVEIKN